MKTLTIFFGIIISFSPLAFANTLQPLPLPPVSQLSPVPIPPFVYTYTNNGPDAPNPIQQVTTDFSAACYNGSGGYDVAPELIVSRIGDYVHIKGEGRVRDNLEFLIRTLHQAGKSFDLSDHISDGTFSFDFVAPLSGGFIRSNSIESSLNVGPYNRSQILRGIELDTGGYHRAPAVVLNLVIDNVVQYSTALSFQNLTVGDPSSNSMDDNIAIIFRDGFSESYGIQPLECWEVPIALRK